MEFPRMVYRVGTMAVLESGIFDHQVVSADEWPQAQADGWHLDQYAAKEADEAAKAADKPADDDGEPTRDELRQQATALGLSFDGRTSAKKLAEMIAAAKAA
jgi:hypothetical protein